MNQTKSFQKMLNNNKISTIKCINKIKSVLENPYQIIVEKMPESVVITSKEGIILYANERLEKLLGTPLKKLLGSNLNTVIKNEEVENFRKSISNKLQEKFTKEINFQKPDNKILTLNLSMSWLPENSLGELCVIIVDLTERKKFELALVNSLQSFDEKNAELIVNNEKLLFANRASVKFSEEEIISKNLLEKTNKELINEITTRIEGEIKLSQNQKLINQILLSSLDNIKLLSLEGEILMMSEGFQKLMEIKDLSIQINKPWPNLWKGLDKEKALNALAKAKNGNIVKFEGFRTTEKGVPKWWEVSITPMRNEQKKIINLLVISHDITQLKDYQEIITKSKYILDVILENYTEGFLLLDNNYNILEFNKLMEKLILQTENIILTKNKNLINQLTKEKQKDFTEIFKNIKNGEKIKLEKFYSQSDLSGVWIKIKFYPILNQDHTITGICIKMEDISTRKKEEAELKESENRLNLILENNITGVWEFNARKEYIFQNKMLDTIFGYETTRQKFNLEIFIDHIIIEDQRWVNKLIMDSISSKREFEFECRIRKSEGIIRWVFIKGIPRLNTEGNLNSVLFIIEDISGQKNNENVIAKIENNLRAIFENAQAGYLLLDNNFLVLEFNNLMSKYFEITEKILLKKNENILNDLSKEGQDSFSKMIKAVYAGENLNFEISKFLPDGSPINLNSKIYPITNKENKVTGACLYYEDITARKIVEKNIQDLNNSLDKKVLERTIQYDILNKELEAFTFSVSHDLRAPLRAVIGYSEILEEEQIKVLNDEGKKMLSYIKNNGQKMGRLIDDLLAFSKLGRKEINKFQLKMNELTKAAVEELNRVFPNHAEITIGSLPDVQGDYNLIHQVMFNLIGNSIKYSSKKENPQISIYSEQRDGKNIYIIKDNGAGFDMRFAEKLFGVFQRLHSEQEFEGNGVGLAIVQRIIHKHGGKVWGEGKENEGACFYFTLN